MGVAVAGSIVEELRILDVDVACSGYERGRQKAVLVAREVIIFQGQIASLVADCCPVVPLAGRDLGAGKGEPLDGRAVVDDQDPLFIGERLGGHHIHDATHALERYLGVYCCEIVGICTGAHLDHVTICGRRYRGCNGRILFADTNGKDAGRCAARHF